jgi:hypothetical protein
MTKSRLEAFSDAVIAIIITIMVLEIKVPHGDTFAVLRPLFPVFLSYAMSFVFLGICDGLDGGESLCGLAGGFVWGGDVVGGDGLFYFDAGVVEGTCPRFGVSDRDRE